MANPQAEDRNLDRTYRLLDLFMKQLGEARLQLGKLHSQLDRRRNYIRICDLTEDREDGEAGT